MTLGERSDFLNIANLRPKKLFNFLKCILLPKKPLLSWYPITYIIDPSSICNLKCPYCYHSHYDPKKYIKNEMLDLNSFRKILNKIKDYAMMIYLYNYGESFLNRDTVKMLALCKKEGIRCRISSNLSFKMSDKQAADIVRSGLYRLTCSIDGPTQEIYGQYRVGGNLEHVFENIKKINYYKKKFRSRTPYIYYRMLVFEWNYQYVEEARQKAQELGVDGFFADPGRYILNGQKVSWDIKNKSWQKIKAKRNLDKLTKADKPCPWLFKNMVLSPSGKNLVCCFINEKRGEHMSLLDNTLEEVWNSKEYIESRKYTLGLSKDRSRVLKACQSCRLL